MNKFYIIYHYILNISDKEDNLVDKVGRNIQFIVNASSDKEAESKIGKVIGKAIRKDAKEALSEHEVPDGKYTFERPSFLYSRRRFDEEVDMDTYFSGEGNRLMKGIFLS